MARHESDREDLLAEATALVRRAELSLDGQSDTIVIGSRRDGSWSVYFGSDPAFHFDSQGRLKRAFHGRRLFRTQGNTLAELTRDRTLAATVLRRRDLDGTECATFLAMMRARLTTLLAAIEQSRVTLLRAVPNDDAAILADYLHFMQPVLSTPEALQLSPRFRGKR